jgi:hypothetical protein
MMQDAWGLLMFVAAVPLAVVGICDPNGKRGSLVMLGAMLLGPLGLVLAAA